MYRIYLFLFYVIEWVFCLHVCLCTIYVSGTHIGQKRVLGPLALKLQIVMSHIVGAGIQMGSQCS